MSDCGVRDAGSGNSSYDSYQVNSGSNTNEARYCHSRVRSGGGTRRYENDHRNYSFVGGGGDDHDDFKLVYVLTAARGGVIGPQGSIVRKIEKETGASVHLNRGKRGTHEPRETEVRILGSTDARQQAWEAIKNAIGSNNCREATAPNASSACFSDQHYRNDNDSASAPASFLFRNDCNNSCHTNRTRDNIDIGCNDRYESNISKNRYSNDSYSNNRPPRKPLTTRAHNNAQSMREQQHSLRIKENEKIDCNALHRTANKKKAATLAVRPPIVKNLYVEDPEVKSMSSEEVASFRMQNTNIRVSYVFAETDDEKLPIANPVKTFEHSFRPYPEILETISRQNFEKPSPIQSQSWPILLSGQDLIGIAQTGSGKTLAFLLPAMLHIEHQKTPRNERIGPTVLVLSPTRELALQIEKEINKYSYKNIKCVCVYGGGGRKEQVTALKNNKPEIIVATPGRLDDLLMTHEIQLDSVTYVVLDEADKMLEMGFSSQINSILINVRPDRQSVIISTTWSFGVKNLAWKYSNNPVRVVVGSLDLTAVLTVSQTIEVVDEKNKRQRLMEFLREMEPDDKVIVICGKNSVTDDIASNLILMNVKCESLHNDCEKNDREQALQDLKSGEVHILIATDFAAQGLEVPDNTHIFIYDFPENIDEYVHQIGQTGRAGRTGHSISLFTRRDWAKAADLIEILTEINQVVPDELKVMAERFEAAKNKKDSFPRGGHYQRSRRGSGDRNFGSNYSGSGGGGRFRKNNF